MPGRNAWCQRNLAERLTFSSFTTLRDDLWAAEEPRDYAIVALPGYSMPKDLDKTSVDAMWLSGAPSERIVVWDGYCPHALHEVIYECFGFAPGDLKGRIGVYRLSKGEIGESVPETRSSAVLNMRPRKPVGLTKVGRENRMIELFAWSSLFGVDDGGSKLHLKDGGRPTMSLYSDFFTHLPRDLTMKARGPAQSRDSKLRGTMWSSSANLKAPRTPINLKRGQGAAAASNTTKEVVRYVGDDVREEIRIRARKSAAMVNARSTPASFYEALLPSNRDRETGLIIGAKEAAREDFNRTLGRPVREMPGQPQETFESDRVDQNAPVAAAAKSWLGRIMASARKNSTGF